MEFEFLYDRTRHLLAIGFNADDARRDTSYYDLLASEARFASFVAIAQGRLPQECWFALGRMLTSADGKPVLVSWSGSMFEYLMPQLVMPSYDGTLLDQTCRAAVARQVAYGRQRSLPWGISESGYNVVDANLNYQYHAFGVPGLGLTRGLSDDLVIAPYASALALLVAPEEACENLEKLATLGMEGPFGFYEAVDYTPARPGERDRAFVHVASPGHEPAVTLARASRPADAGSFRIRPLVPGDAHAAAGAGPEDLDIPHARGPARRGTRLRERARCLDPRPHDRGLADTRSPAPVERPPPRHGHKRRGRILPLEGSRAHPLA
jgi:hypothetical protein